MKAFFGSIKNKSLKVRLPRYLKKDGFYPLIDRMVYKPSKKHYILPRSNFIKRTSNMINEAFKKIDNKILKSVCLEDKLFIKIKTPNPIKNKEIKEITIKPSVDGNRFKVYYVYKVNKPKEITHKTKKEMGIDFGYNNLSFCATNNNHLLIDGRYLKSLNQFYHKRYAKLSSIRPNQNIITKNMRKLINKRNNQMTYYVNKAAKIIIDFAIKEKITDIYIGYNEGFKDINLNDEYNQMAKSIPIAKLRDRIIYLASVNNINTFIVNESYTSSSSFIDKDEMHKDATFSGIRIKRGLYKTGNRLINADLNQALNILRKGNPEIEVGSRGLNTPKRTYLFN